MAVKKDEKKGTWYYYGVYTNFLGKRKQYKKRGFRTKREAKEAEAAFLADPDEHTSMTLDEVVNLYVARASAQGVKESTAYSNIKYYNKHIRPVFGRLNVATISASMIETWIIEMKSKKVSGHFYKYTTINQAKATLSKFLHYACKLGLIRINPCALVPNLKPDQHEIMIKKENFWELSEFKQFIDAVDSDQWKDVFYFLFDTGVREGEMMALRWKDIDLTQKVASIRASVTSKSYASGPIITTPKNTRSIRTIDLPESLVNRLILRYEREKKKDGFSMDYFVFWDIRPMSRNALAHNLDKYIAKAKVKRITPHGFRHSHASLLIEKGLPDALIAERLGHTTEELHKTYAHIYQRRRDAMKQQLDIIF